MIGRFTLANPVQLKHSDVPSIRGDLLKQQNGVCPICNREIKDPCLDHSHTRRNKGSGLVRGVLCRACNVLVAKMENNCVRYGIVHMELPDVLRNMATYLEQTDLPMIHPSEAPKPKLLKKSSYNKLKKVYEGRAKFPPYPKSKRLTKDLERLFCKHELEPEFYK